MVSFSPSRRATHRRRQFSQAFPTLCRRFLFASPVVTPDPDPLPEATAFPPEIVCADVLAVVPVIAAADVDVDDG